MSGGDEWGGCGCLILFLVLCLVGGGFFQGLALLSIGWIGYLVLIGFSIGVIIAVARIIAGD
jgi:hypothetical protein